MVAPALLAVLALLVAAPGALAGPGGALSGELSVEWASSADAPPGNAWNGAATLTLEAGSAATERAMAAVHASGRVYREPRAFFLQAASLTALRGSETSRVGGPEWCYDAEANPVAGESTSESTVTAVTEPLVAMSVDQPDVNLLSGRGRIDLSFHTDNPGYAEGSSTWPFPAAGEYFMPVHGAADTTGFTSHCGERVDASGVRTAFSTRGDALVPFAFALWLNTAKLPLVRHAGGWQIDLVKTEEATTDRAVDPLPLTMTYRAGLRMSDDLRGMEARCRVPGKRQMKRARSVSRARSLLERAGFPKARFAGGKAWQGIKPGRMFVDPGFTSTGYRRCGDRPRFFRARRPG